MHGLTWLAAVGVRGCSRAAAPLRWLIDVRALKGLLKTRKVGTRSRAPVAVAAGTAKRVTQPSNFGSAAGPGC